MNIILAPHHVNKTEAARMLDIKSYDTALPQDWLEDFVRKLSMATRRPAEDLYGHVLSSFVWSYDHASIFGRPHPLTIEAFGLLKAHDTFTGTHYADEVKEQLNVLSLP